jgi:hypothetical protein
MAKVRNEGNRNLSFAAQTGSRSQQEEKTLRDFNAPTVQASASKQVDGSATKDHSPENPPTDVAEKMAQHRGKDIHQQATKGKSAGKDKDGPSP